MELKLWPRSLLGQMLLSVALALLVAQGISGSCCGARRSSGAKSC